MIETKATPEGRSGGCTRQRRSGGCTRTRPRAFAAVATLLVLALVSSVSLAGTRFYYCEAMGLTRSDPCQGSAETSGARDPAGVVREGHTDCCSVVILPSAPVGARTAAPSVAPPALAAILAPETLVERPCAGDARTLVRGFERWRPPPKPASEVRAQLMVFLT